MNPSTASQNTLMVQSSLVVSFTRAVQTHCLVAMPKSPHCKVLARGQGHVVAFYVTSLPTWNFAKWHGQVHCATTGQVTGGPGRYAFRLCQIRDGHSVTKILQIHASLATPSSPYSQALQSLIKVLFWMMLYGWFPGLCTMSNNRR